MQKICIQLSNGLVKGNSALLFLEEGPCRRLYLLHIFWLTTEFAQAYRFQNIIGTRRNLNTLSLSLFLCIQLIYLILDFVLILRIFLSCATLPFGQSLINILRGLESLERPLYSPSPQLLYFFVHLLVKIVCPDQVAGRTNSTNEEYLKWTTSK